MTMKYDKFLHINLTKLYQVGKYEMRYFFNDNEGDFIF